MKPGFKRIGWSCVVVMTIALAFVSWQTRQQERTLAELRDPQSALEKSQAAPAAGSAAPSAELVRLREEHLELLRLRGEVTGLRRSATETNEDPEIRSLIEEQQRLARQVQSLAHMQQRATCIENLEKIYQAKQQWAAHHPENRADPVTLEDLREFMDGQIPVCPEGGVYSPNRMGARTVAPPACSVHGSLLPE